MTDKPRSDGNGSSSDSTDCAANADCADATANAAYTANTDRAKSGGGRESVVRAYANPVFAPVHCSRARYVVMRGSAGSGKSADTAQLYILRLLSEPGRNLLCVRRTDDSNRSSTFAELVSAIRRLKLSRFFEITVSPLSIVCRTNGNAVLFRGVLDERQRERLKSITFPAGKLTDIWVEEATEIESDDLEILDDRLRGRLPAGLFYQIKLTFNPVSIDHWIKTRFFDHADPQVLTHHSTYLDNRFLDPAFALRMERRRLLDPDGYRVYALGEWGVTGGQYFPEWRDSLHTVTPFPIPSHWRRYIALDYGLDMLAAYLIVMEPSGRAFVTQEVYQSGLIISDAARMVRENLLREPVYQIFAPPDLWNRRQDTGLSAADLFGQHGVSLSRAENDRVMGWLNLHEWLKPRKNEYGEEMPSLRVFRSCENLIRTLPALRHDPKNPADTANTPHELTHAPDAIRYFIAGRPCPGMEMSGGGKYLHKEKSRLRL